MSYISLDGRHWYVDGDGNHRTAIARFAFRARRWPKPLMGVARTLVDVDREFMALHEELMEVLARQKNAVAPVVCRRPAHRDDGPGWKRDHYDIRVSVPGFTVAQDKEGARQCLAVLKGRRRRRWWPFGPAGN